MIKYDQIWWWIENKNVMMQINQILGMNSKNKWHGENWSKLVMNIKKKCYGENWLNLMMNSKVNMVKNCSKFGDERKNAMDVMLTFIYVIGKCHGENR